MFDIGANHGNRVEIFLSLGARVVAVEPQPSCLESLNRFAGDHQGRLTIFPGVAGPNVGTATIRLGSTDELSSLSDSWISAVQASGRFSTVEWHRSMTVDMTTLESLIAQHGEPSFLKIDVEGFELEVLRGLSGRPASLRALSFEFTPEGRSVADACVNYCAGLGRISCNFSEGESMSLVFSDWVSPNDLKRFLNRYEGDNTRFGDIYVRFD